MSKVYSTGELAKLCNVSSRTIQYYDREGILKPAELNQSGHRVYTEEEVKKLRCICLYKALGFSLEEIKSIVDGKDNFSLLCDLLMRQQKKIDEEMEGLQNKREKISAVLLQIRESGQAKVQNIEEMDQLLIKKRKHKKTDIMTYVFMAGYILFLIAGFPSAISAGGFYPYVMLLAAAIMLLGLVYYHSQVNSYVCPKCKYKFSINFLKDLISPNGLKYGKYLKCPKCGRRGWVKETFPEE